MGQGVRSEKIGAAGEIEGITVRSLHYENRSSEDQTEQIR
jgi:hypothetical protein